RLLKKKVIWSDFDWESTSALSDVPSFRWGGYPAARWRRHRRTRSTEPHSSGDIESTSIYIYIYGQQALGRNEAFVRLELSPSRPVFPGVRYERLEDQLNDLTELHQHETINLKQELAAIEEKVAYQAYERARDIQEALESCQTRVSKLELQQQQQQQSTAQPESADAKVLLGKCINIMLAIATVILVCVSTAAKFAAPLLRSRLHLGLTCTALSLLALVWRHWDNLQGALERTLLPPPR
ncbi:transmembrane and coiled-coil domain protein 3-like, partial [Gadus macrocephalus]|uniref:transmembrane and coiled-coil domain protein 3-like n=1 Tax=Gadus macrocephalus TaxID=80720 RepID=UPI0028CB3184